MRVWTVNQEQNTCRMICEECGYVTGNVFSPTRDDTPCPRCGHVTIGEPSTQHLIELRLTLEEANCVLRSLRQGHRHLVDIRPGDPDVQGTNQIAERIIELLRPMGARASRLP